MASLDPIQLNIEVSASDATIEDIDYMTRQLLIELRELNIESVSLVRSEHTPNGAKGDPITIGSIALDLLPAVLPSVLGLVQAWVSRGQGRLVKIKGEDFEYEGPPEEFPKFLELHQKRTRSRQRRKRK